MNIWSAVIHYRFVFAAKRLWKPVPVVARPTRHAWSALVFCVRQRQKQSGPASGDIECGDNSQCSKKIKSGDKSPHSKSLLAALLILFAALARADGKPAPAETLHTLPWLSGLAEGQRRAAADHRPMLIRMGASWCPACRKLAAEIEKPSVQAELARWTPVYLDADKAEEEAAELNVTAVPALRVRTMLGEPVAARDGFLSAEDLVSWLKKQYEAAAAEADEVLLSGDEPDAAAVVRLVRQFQQRNAAVREAAIRRLAPYPQKARQEVVRAFVEGTLSGRLAALELLHEWHAPVADLDPWQPRTLTKERLAALGLWAEKFQPPAVETKKVSEQALVEARREIDRMLKAAPADAEAIRHRLAGLGEALLPEVASRLKDAAGDEPRQRLWALRYRLVAADSLALRWPGGLERLADSDPRHRQQAADELARLATAADQPLLVELFSDNDPLVREFSLRGLQNIGGKETAAALAKLLADPEPNVRAAVLKQLEEKPDPSIVPKLTAYLKTEKDADLLVHAVRFLRAAGGEAATRALVPMLRHESWQVRAEACEALGKMRENFPHSYTNGERVIDKAEVEIYAALLDLLDDADAFVVSRAVEGLSGVDMLVAVDSLVRAAAKHPDLAPKIVEMLAQGQKMRVAALPHLRKFRKDADPRVRAAALEGLCTALPSSAGDEILAGLQDPSDKVRTTAAGVCFRTMEAQRTGMAQELRQRRSGNTAFASPTPFTGLTTFVVSGAVSGDLDLAPVPAPAPVQTAPLGGLSSLLQGIFTKSGTAAKPAVESKPALEIKPGLETKPVVEIKPVAPAKPAAEQKPPAAGKPEEGKEAEEGPYDSWLKEYYAGKRRPKWSADVLPPLEKMLEAKNVDERLAASIALVPLGKTQAVLPVVYDIARSDPKKYQEAIEVLPWLVWEQRQAAFQQFRKMAPTPDAVSYLVYSLSQVREPRASEQFWELLADAKTSDSLAGAIERGLLNMQGIETWYSPRNAGQYGVTKKMLLDLAASARPRLARGGDLQRLVALGLLTYADPDEAVRAAEKLEADVAAGAALRADAFQVRLASLPPKEAAGAAAGAMSGKDLARQKAALRFFVYGADSLSPLRDSIMVSTTNESRAIRSGEPIVPKPPEGLRTSQLVPLLADGDPAVAAEAGYLLALLGESRGLDPLLRYAQQRGKGDSRLQRLAYRAIAALDDSNQVPVLRKIYAGLERYEVSEFYWTIRIMTGPEILKFRKQVRDEVGMSQLQ